MRRQRSRCAPEWNIPHHVIGSHGLFEHLLDAKYQSAHENAPTWCLSLYLPGDRAADKTGDPLKAPPCYAETVWGSREFAQSKQKATAHPVSHLLLYLWRKKQTSPALIGQITIPYPVLLCHLKGKITCADHFHDSGQGEAFGVTSLCLGTRLGLAWPLFHFTGC